jgi:hypothetical protein
VLRRLSWSGGSRSIAVEPHQPKVLARWSA